MLQTKEFEKNITNSKRIKYLKYHRQIHRNNDII